MLITVSYFNGKNLNVICETMADEAGGFHEQHQSRKALSSYALQQFQDASTKDLAKPAASRPGHRIFPPGLRMTTW